MDLNDRCVGVAREGKCCAEGGALRGKLYIFSPGNCSPSLILAIGAVQLSGRLIFVFKFYFGCLKRPRHRHETVLRRQDESTKEPDIAFAARTPANSGANTLILP